MEYLCARKVQEAALLLDLPRLVEQTLSRVALGLSISGEVEFSPSWIEERIGEAIEDLLRQNYQSQEGGDRSAPPGDESSLFLIEGLGLDPEQATARAVAYNALTHRVRRAFFAIAIHKIEFDDLVGTEWKTAEQLRDDTLTALETLLNKKRR